ncbi:hypothetical protein BH10BAC5_BH10BAC5_26350 [soil metagenome]
MFKKNLQLSIFISFIAIASCQYSCNNNETPITPIDTNDNRITVYDTEPSWSSDGRTIAYGGGSDSAGYKIFAIDTNSQNQRIISTLYGHSISWSPDGKWILYEAGGTIYKKRVGGDTAKVQLTFNGGSFYPSWSKDGEWIAFDCNFESPTGGHFIWKMRSDGSEQKRIIGNDTTGEVRQPDWFPDGIRLVVSRFIGHGFSEIAIIDTSGNSLAVLTNDINEADENPKVSNDGSFITWWKPVGLSRIFVMKADGTEQRQVNSHSIHPNWSPDGKMLTYTNTIYNDGRIWILNINSSIRKKISF